jgi:hypothetical protein
LQLLRDALQVPVQENLPPFESHFSSELRLFGDRMIDVSLSYGTLDAPVTDTLRKLIYGVDCQAKRLQVHGASDAKLQCMNEAGVN